MKISPRWQTCRNSREKETRTPLFESRAGKICFCQMDFEIQRPWQLHRFKGHREHHLLSLHCMAELKDLRWIYSKDVRFLFGLFLHHPHCPSDDSWCPCGHHKSLAGESTVHLHFSPRETRNSSITHSRAAVTSTQMGVNTMQPTTSDLQIITWQLKHIKGGIPNLFFF